MQLPFKTAVITDEISQDVAIAADLAREFGLDSLEIRSAWEKGPHLLSAEELERIRGIAEDRGLTVCGVAPPFFKCELADTRAIAEHLDILRRSCAAARALGTSQVRGFAFWRRGPLEGVMPEVAAHLKEAARIAEGEGAVLALENEFSTCNNNVARTLQLIEAVDSPALRLLYDPGNDVFDEEGEIAWPDSYELARGRFSHMHLKDPKRDPNTGQIVTMAIGEGEVNVPALMAALLGDGFTGTVSLETHYRREPMESEVQRLPLGASFSAGGYVATRECLEKWFAILEELSGAAARGV